MQANFAGKASCPANNHSADIISTGISWHNTICDEKRGCTCVVSDYAVRREEFFTLLVGVPGKFLYLYNQWPE